MKPIFKPVRSEALTPPPPKKKKKRWTLIPAKSQMKTAYNYFLENNVGLTRSLDNHLKNIDKNLSERLVMSHVLGRKTWQGTHSKGSAKPAAIHFLIVESCKMIGVTPHEFYADAAQRIHDKLGLLTPQEYKQRRKPYTC